MKDPFDFHTIDMFEEPETYINEQLKRLDLVRTVCLEIGQTPEKTESYQLIKHNLEEMGYGNFR